MSPTACSIIMKRDVVLSLIRPALGAVDANADPNIQIVFQ